MDVLRRLPRVERVVIAEPLDEPMVTSRLLGGKGGGGGLTNTRKQGCGDQNKI